MLNREGIQSAGVLCNRSSRGLLSDGLFFLHLLVNTNEGSRASLLTSSNVALAVYYQVCNLTSAGRYYFNYRPQYSYKLKNHITTLNCSQNKNGHNKSIILYFSSNLYLEWTFFVKYSKYIEFKCLESYFVLRMFARQYINITAHKKPYFSPSRTPRRVPSTGCYITKSAQHKLVDRSRDGPT